MVSADVDQLVAAGARHISFADPDFLNAPHDARRVLAGLRDRHPALTLKATIKVEHLLRYPQALAELAESGCTFVVSAFESVSNRILGLLTGHTVADMSEAVIALRSHGIDIRLSWLPFTPWTMVDDLVGLIDFVAAYDLVANVDPVQYSVRLLVPDGSLLLAEPAMTAHLGSFDPARLGRHGPFPTPSSTISRWRWPPWSRRKSARTRSGPLTRSTGWCARTHPTPQLARPGEPLPPVLVGSEPGSPSRGSAAPNRPKPNWPRWRRSSEASSVIGVPLSGGLRSWGYTVSKGP